ERLGDTLLRLHPRFDDLLRTRRMLAERDAAITRTHTLFETTFLAPATGLAGRGLARLDGRGAAGQFAIGMLLGVAWSPCVGPTLGAASLLASRGEHLGAVAATMAAFAAGAVLPLLLAGALPAGRLAAARARLGAAGRAGGTVLGACLALAGILVLTGLDKRLEAWVLDVSPDWLVRLSTAL
ncbi:MAG: cytochrome c biogenesis protein CcdA, partial [Alphaproteobacteria bacterium]